MQDLRLPPIRHQIVLINVFHFLSKLVIMKKLVILFVLVICSGSLQAQLLVKGENINELSITFITVHKELPVVGFPSAIVKFDQDDKVRGNGQGDKITREDGKALKFHSVVAILEYVSQRGWEYIGQIKDNDALNADNEVMLFRKK